MSKKTAIVSCYYKHNYGSMLQALATQMALDKLGHENETIDISGFSSELRNRKLLFYIKAVLTTDILKAKAGMLRAVILRRLSKTDYARGFAERSKRFDAFMRKSFVLSKSYTSLAETGSEALSNYSSVIVGSDQNWLPVNIAADYYTLNWVPDEVNTVTYATSFGQSSLPRWINGKAASFLKRLRHISVREESGQKLVKGLTGRSVPVVCDPTLLLTGDEWKEIMNPDPIIKEPYILVYFLGNNPPHREFVRRLRSETGYRIVMLPHIDEYIKSDEGFADTYLYDAGPADFLRLIHDASYVCTDSFHCSGFSILFRKEFFTFRRFAGNLKASTNSRLDTLFSVSGITGRLIAGTEDIGDCLARKIDYEMVSEKLDSLREMSMRFLSDSLADNGSTDI